MMRRPPTPKDLKGKPARTPPTSFRLSPQTRQRLAALAARWETSQAGALERAVREAHAREERKG